MALVCARPHPNVIQDWKVEFSIALQSLLTDWKTATITLTYSVLVATGRGYVAAQCGHFAILRLWELSPVWCVKPTFIRHLAAK